MLMSKPVVAMIAAIGSRAGLKDKMKMAMERVPESEKVMRKLAKADAIENPPKPKKPKVSKEARGFLERKLF